MDYYITYECECGETIKHRCRDLSSDGIPEIPWDIAAQSDFKCESCGNVYATGDFESELLEKDEAEITEAMQKGDE